MLNKIRKATEHDNYFEMDDGSGKPFKVAKAGISDAMADRIRRMYCGGVVKKYADGGAVSAEEPAAEEPRSSLEEQEEFADIESPPLTEGQLTDQPLPSVEEEDPEATRAAQLMSTIDEPIPYDDLVGEPVESASLPAPAAATEKATERSPAMRDVDQVTGILKNALQDSGLAPRTTTRPSDAAGPPAPAVSAAPAPSAPLAPAAALTATPTLGSTAVAVPAAAPAKSSEGSASASAVTTPPAPAPLPLPVPTVSAPTPTPAEVKAPAAEPLVAPKPEPKPPVTAAAPADAYVKAAEQDIQRIDRQLLDISQQPDLLNNVNELLQKFPKQPAEDDGAYLARLSLFRETASELQRQKKQDLQDALDAERQRLEVVSAAASSLADSQRRMTETKERLADARQTYRQSIDAADKESSSLFGAGVANNIFGYIGVALAGLAAGWSGRPESAFAMVDDMIKRRLEARRIESSERYNQLRNAGLDVDDAQKIVQADTANLKAALAEKARSSRLTVQQQKALESYIGKTSSDASKLYGEVFDKAAAKQLQSQMMGIRENALKMNAQRFAASVMRDFASANASLTGQNKIPFASLEQYLGNKQLADTVKSYAKEIPINTDVRPAVSVSPMGATINAPQPQVAATGVVLTAPGGSMPAATLVPPASPREAIPQQVTAVAAPGTPISRPAKAQPTAVSAQGLPSVQAQAAAGGVTPKYEGSSPADAATRAPAINDVPNWMVRSSTDSRKDPVGLLIAGYRITPDEYSSILSDKEKLGALAKAGYTAKSQRRKDQKTGQTYTYYRGIKKGEDSKLSGEISQYGEFEASIKTMLQYVPMYDASKKDYVAQKSRDFVAELFAPGELTAVEGAIDIAEAKLRGLGAWDTGLERLMKKVVPSPQSKIVSTAASRKSEFDNFFNFVNKARARIKNKLNEKFIGAANDYQIEYPLSADEKKSLPEGVGE